MESRHRPVTATAGAGQQLLGVDLGGTKIEAALLDVDGRMLRRRRVATPGQDYRTLLRAVAALCDGVDPPPASAPRRLPLGIGTPGSPSPLTGLMRNCNSTLLNGRALREDLTTATGRPVRIANDADCFALSEAGDGAGAGARSVLGLILGTGVGGGLVIEGRLLHGPNAVAGEWGHNRMPLERLPELPRALRRSRPCYCGRADCVETWLSGPGLAQTHRDLHGSDLAVAALHEAAPDEAHGQTIAVYTRLLAAALAAVVNVVDPEVVVLGGGLSNIAGIRERLPAALATQLFSDCLRTAVRRARHGDSSGVRGAAWLWR